MLCMRDLLKPLQVGHWYLTSSPILIVILHLLSPEPFCLEISTLIVCDSSKVRGKGFPATTLRCSAEIWANFGAHTFLRVAPRRLTKRCQTKSFSTNWTLELSQLQYVYHFETQIQSPSQSNTFVRSLLVLHTKFNPGYIYRNLTGLIQKTYKLA